jgi:hypothetical protein
MRRLVLAFVVAAGSVVTGARQPAQTPSTQAPQFRGSVDIVRLDVTVLDKDRRPIRGLSQGDFTVVENGVPQPISAFSPVDVPDAAPDPRAAPWMREVAPDVKGNAAVQERRLFILAIDDATIRRRQGRDGVHPDGRAAGGSVRGPAVGRLPASPAAGRPRARRVPADDRSGGRRARRAAGRAVRAA